jgi:hypothetical protein
MVQRQRRSNGNVERIQRGAPRNAEQLVALRPHGCGESVRFAAEHQRCPLRNLQCRELVERIRLCPQQPV